jgi:E3 ubiquitin-protein ligase RFWD2
VHERRAPALHRLTDDIAKATQFSHFRCRATLMHTTRFPEAPGADVFKASNIVSAIEFDRESEFVATAGVTKRIKIFEFSNILRNLADVHYPVKEIQAEAKLSWVVWNPYIRYHLASSDYEGMVTVWDANRGVAICDYEEHEKRAWSVDFCGPNPTLFASGSDDGRVKLWSTNERDSVLTIDNHANVCSVKFNPVRGEMLAFGSAHHHVHYYDLRNHRQPVQIFQSHRKTVSYVKFTSETELVSACADSSIKLWNLETMELERTFTGHSNDRHFVGLSVTPDYIACGSENNAIYTYYKALPDPIAQYRFAARDPLTGEEVAQEEDEMLFVSSVCWCPRYPRLLIGANSLGVIQVLELADQATDGGMYQ